MGRSRRGRVASSGGASSGVGERGSMTEKKERNLYLYLYLYLYLLRYALTDISSAGGGASFMGREQVRGRKGQTIALPRPSRARADAAHAAHRLFMGRSTSSRVETATKRSFARQTQLGARLLAVRLAR